MVGENNASTELTNEGILSWLTNLEDEVKVGVSESKAADVSIFEVISRLEGDSESREQFNKTLHVKTIIFQVTSGCFYVNCVWFFSDLKNYIPAKILIMLRSKDTNEVIS